MKKITAALLLCFCTIEAAMAESEPEPVTIVETYQSENKLIMDAVSTVGVALYSDQVHSLSLTNLEDGDEEVINADGERAWVKISSANISMDVTTTLWYAAEVKMKTGKNPLVNRVVEMGDDFSVFMTPIRCNFAGEVNLDGRISPIADVKYTKVDCDLSSLQ